MKKTMFLSLGLLACVAFSPQPAFAAPDTGPKVDNVEVFSSSASADLIMPDEWVFEISNTYNFSPFGQANGQETVLHRSDHLVMTTHYILKKYLDSKKLVNGYNYGLGRSDHERSCSGYIIDGNSWKCKTLNASENQNFNVIGAASMAALHSHQMVRTMRRPPAWPIRPSRL